MIVVINVGFKSLFFALLLLVSYNL